MKKISKKMCPCCGSQNIEEKQEAIRREISNDFVIEFEGITNSCLDCKEEGDFFSVNDKLFTLAKEKKEKRFFENMLNEISKNNSLAYIERVLALPQRTLTRWKKRGASSAGITLTKFIATYPWLLKVADHKFDPSYANQELIQQAAISLSDIASAQNLAVDASIIKKNERTNYIIGVSEQTSEGYESNSKHVGRDGNILYEDLNEDLKKNSGNNSQNEQIGEATWTPAVA